MKQLYSKKRILYASIALFCLVLGCKDDDPSPSEQRLIDLTATWNVSSVINDGTNVSDQFTGFSLTVSGDKTYATVNGGNPWPASGTFDLNPDDLDTFIRDDNVEVSIVEITATALSLSFQMSNVRSVRSGTSGITGSFTFNLTKTN
ncbi:hypothetical protein BFP97_07010 [Roseivirga sp. 4D4]|uniref:hypothetical protein n=1 Tax=Roseivirga sp. 4D4 TaxID=1889784 RepID=UPI0008536034|nr:hypothetical protein [Roseivirga sp. 4D4]OEK01276.1 hypothetical protein BFP97_07010 [Roseivirga sp. 4D4]